MIRDSSKGELMTRTPNISEGGIETSIQLISDTQEATAQILEQIGWCEKAKSVRDCVAPADEASRTCKLRCCPSCQVRRSVRFARLAIDVIKEMRSPVLLLLTLPSRNLYDLRQALRRIRTLLRDLRLTHFRNVRAAIGNIEPKLADSKQRWSLHIHLVVDGTDRTLLAAKRAWEADSKGWGKFKLDSQVFQRSVDSRNPFALARYMFKTQDVCPAPGTMEPWLLKLLWSGIHGQQLPVRWGGARGRRAKP